MIKQFGTAIIISCVLLFGSNAAIAAASDVPEPFRGFDDDSKYRFGYADLTAMLDAVVADVGRSNRMKAPQVKSQTGTRMTAKVNRATVNEGNRFYFETFENDPANKQRLEAIQQNLENSTSEIPLEKFSRDEQLAFWLNLYNATILNEITKIYPQRNLKKALFGKNSILDKKLLTVEGVSLSLNDIQHTILKENYDRDPLVIYGLHQGIIGSPNIRRSAYTGANVYAALEENAILFINSNRGTISRNSKTFRVSSFYERNEEFFPNFTVDLSSHLLKYLDGEEHAALQVASKIKPDINDWTVTDLGGTRREISGSFSGNSAALMGAVSGASSSNYGGAAAATGAASSGGISSAVARQVQEKTGKSTEPEEEEEEAPDDPEAAPQSDDNQTN
ncbi:MAG: DUF547 domain-containing protein [Gammaproteobacteria bacterium]|nr:DUF547 domain-containing protein [Gammaproteobacteria bacterium]